MTNPMTDSKRQQLFILFIGGLLLVGLIVLFSQFSGNSFYVEAYRPEIKASGELKKKVQKYNEAAAEAEGIKPSVEPAAPGFKEREIEKSEGDGYRTY